MAVLKRPDGGQIYYWEAGAKGAPVMLFLHGWAMSGAVFERQVEAFQDHFHMIAPDFRGHGKSSALPLSGGIETLSDDIHALIQALEPRPLIIIGWSMGAIVAWDMARRYGLNDIAGMAVIDMTPRICNDADWQLGMKGGHCDPQAQRAAIKLQADWPAYTMGVVRRILATGSKDEALMAHLRRFALDCDAPSLARLWVDMVRQDFRAFLPQFAAPSLIAYGAKSQLYSPQTAAWLVDALPHAQSVAYPHSGHAPHLEEARAFNERLGAFAANSTAIHQDNLGGLSCQ